MTTEPTGIAVQPGVYKDVSFETYRLWDAANISMLGGFTRTAAHVRYEQLHGRPDTEAKKLGRAVHLAVLEPERFAREVVVAPHVDRRTKVGKADWAAFLAEHPTATHIEAEDFERLAAMRDSILAHPTAGIFFRGRGLNELSIVWDDPQTGVRCKARIDRIAPINTAVVIGDLKTARDAGRHAFESDLSSHGNARQAAHYTSGMQVLMPTEQPRQFVFFVVESAAPFLTACYDVDPDSMAHAENERQSFLRAYRECRATGIWSGYAEGIETAALPAWTMKRRPEGEAA